MEDPSNQEDCWDLDSRNMDKLNELSLNKTLLNETDDRAIPPLLAALVCNETNVAEWLLSQGTGVNSSDSQGNSPLLMSAFKGNTVLTKKMIDMGANINHQNKEGHTSLMAAAYSGVKDTVQLLCENGAALNTQSNLGLTALMFATVHLNINVVKYLVRYANCNISDNEGNSVMAIAAKLGNIELLECFLKSKVNVNAANKQGKTALMYAAEEDHFSVVKYLANTAKASKDISMKDGRKAADIALARKHRNIANFLGITVVDELLITTDLVNIISAAYSGDLKKVKSEVTDSKVNVNATDKRGRTALMAASQQGHKDIVIYLVENKANVNQICNVGMTALAYSIQGMHTDIQNYLLLQNAGLDVKDQNGRTVFMRCVENGNLKLVKALDLLGCDIFYRESNLRKNSLMIAAENGYMQIVQYLVSQGCRKQSESLEDITAEQYAFINNQQEVYAWLQSYDIVGENEISQNEEIMTCAEVGDCEGLARLLNLGCTTNCRNNIQNTPLIIASENGHATFAKCLLEHGAIVNYRNSLVGRTALFMAVLRGSGLVIDHLLNAGASANVVDRKGHTPLMGAAQELYVDIAISLLKHGARANTIDYHSKSVMAFAAQSGCIDIAKLLLEHGADVNVVDEDGDSPLHLASAGGHIEIVKLLVHSGANVDHINNKGLVAMDVASQSSHDDIIMYLLSCGAIHPIVHKLFPSVQTTNESRIISREDILAIQQRASESTAVPQVESFSQSECKGILKEALFAICNDKSFDATAAQEVLAHGFDVNNVDGEGNTALLVAVKNKHRDSSEWLINAGANLNMQDQSGMTALMYACQYECDNLINLLLHKGVDVNITDSKKNIALSHAVKCNYTFAADTLLKAGADGNHQDNNGNTPLISATICQSKEMVHLLLRHKVSTLSNDSKGRSALFHAVSCCMPASLEIVHVLVRNEVVLDNCDQNGDTPLILSILSQNNDIARELISMGCNLSHENHFGQSALLMAIANGNIELINLILQNACQLNVSQLTIALQFLIYNNQYETFPLFCYYEIILQCLKTICNASVLDQLTRQNNKDAIVHLQKNNLIDSSELCILLSRLNQLDYKGFRGTTELFHHIISTSNSQQIRSDMISAALTTGCYEEVNQLDTTYGQRYSCTSQDWQCVILACNEEGLWKVTESNDSIMDTKLEENLNNQNTKEKCYPTDMADIYKAIEKYQEEKRKLHSENSMTGERLSVLSSVDQLVSVEKVCDEKNKELNLIQEQNLQLQVKLKELLQEKQTRLREEEWQACDCGKLGCQKCEFEKEALTMFKQSDIQFTGLPEDSTSNEQATETQEIGTNRTNLLKDPTPRQQGPTLVVFLSPLNNQPKRSKENVRNVSVVSHNDKPYPKMYLFKFHASVSQCSLDGREMPSNACAIIAMLFAQKFIKRPVVLPVVPPPINVPDEVFRYAVLAIREGNEAHELNFEGMPVDLGPDEVGLLTNHLGVKLVKETDVDTREPDTLVDHVLSLKANQVILFIKNYRVVSVLSCNSNKWLLLFDSHPHLSFKKMYGVYLFLAKKDNSTIKKLFSSYDTFCDPRPFYGKFAIFDV